MRTAQVFFHLPESMFVATMPPITLATRAATAASVAASWSYTCCDAAHATLKRGLVNAAPGGCGLQSLAGKNFRAEKISIWPSLHSSDADPATAQRSDMLP